MNYDDETKGQGHGQGQQSSVAELIGWIVEWGPNHQRKKGTVLNESDQEGYVIIYNEELDREYEVPILNTRFIKIRPASLTFKASHWNKTTGSMNNPKQKKVEKKIINLRMQKNSDEGLLVNEILEGLEKKGMNAVKALSLSLGKTNKNKEDTIDEYSDKFDSYSETDENNNVNNNSQSERDEDEDDDDEEENEEEDDEDEEDEDESDNDDEEDEEEDDSDDDSDEDSEDDEDDIIDFKVVVYPTEEVRGFSFRKDILVSKTMKTLQKDCGASTPPKMYYRDFEGDEVLLAKNSDIKYAIRTHEKLGGSNKLRLIAKFSGSKSNGNAELFSPRQVKEAFNSSPAQYQQYENNGEIIWQRGELIGSGSFGDVYSGIDLSRGEQIAIKEISLRHVKKLGGKLKTLKDEVAILSTVSHPNIVKYFGAEYSKNVVRIFLELASSGTVKDFLNKFGAFGEPLLRKYMIDILAGLHFLHSKGIIHRDIKPTNLLIDKNTVKLADFGCSAIVQLSQDGEKSERVHNTVIGTTIYMSPEVMQGDENEAGGYGRKADVWSLGITMCEMALGRPPFKNGPSAIYAVCVSKETPTLPDSMTPDAHAFLSKCLVEDPDRRADCRELICHSFCRPQTSEDIRIQVKSKGATNVFSSTTKLVMDDLHDHDDDGDDENLDGSEFKRSMGYLQNSREMNMIGDDSFMRMCSLDNDATTLMKTPRS